MSKQRSPINIGISADKRERIAEGLSRLLADSYTQSLDAHEKHSLRED